MTDQNKATIRSLYAEIDAGNLDAVKDVWSHDHAFLTRGSPPMDAAARLQQGDHRRVLRPGGSRRGHS
jgi:ketosteroid isomerase-like protein